jgi:hypothetical protein
VGICNKMFMGIYSICNLYIGISMLSMHGPSKHFFFLLSVLYTCMYISPFLLKLV